MSARNFPGEVAQALKLRTAWLICLVLVGVAEPDALKAIPNTLQELPCAVMPNATWRVHHIEGYQQQAAVNCAIDSGKCQAARAAMRGLEETVARRFVRMGDEIGGLVSDNQAMADAAGKKHGLVVYRKISSGAHVFRKRAMVQIDHLGFYYDFNGADRED